MVRDAQVRHFLVSEFSGPAGFVHPSVAVTRSNVNAAPLHLQIGTNMGFRSYHHSKRMMSIHEHSSGGKAKKQVETSTLRVLALGRTRALPSPA